MRRLAVPLVIMLALVGCGASEKPANCLQVSKAMLNKIASGQESGAGMKMIRGAAVRSPDFSKVYFIAAEFTATGVGKNVGVWTSNSLKPGGVIMAVDGFAQEFTTWTDSNKSSVAISGADPSVEVARSCL